MSYLIRIGVGDFNIEDSYSLDYLKTLNEDELKSIICPIDESINHLDYLVVEDKFYNGLINGNIIPMKNNISKHYKTNTPIKIYCSNAFVGIGRIIIENHIVNIKMDKVLI